MMAEMHNAAAVEETLLELRDTLVQYGYRDWAQVMHDLMCDWQEAKTDATRKQVAYQIMRLFRGMGSFNDLVLNQGASPQEEEAFDRAQTRLYDLASSFRTSPRSG
jgi:hypothetical protein